MALASEFGSRISWFPFSAMQESHVKPADSLVTKPAKQRPRRRQRGLRRSVLSRVPGADCQSVIISEASKLFTIERLLHAVGQEKLVAMFWVFQPPCHIEGCSLLNLMWDGNAPLKSGYCHPFMCATGLFTTTLRDPVAVPLDCTSFDSLEGWKASLAEFRQDWFLHWNFLRHRGFQEEEGLYVDVGAAFPFRVSNTIIFDRCYGWDGICIEPNPFLESHLYAYRSCKVFRSCVLDQPTNGSRFLERDGTFAFAADCLSLYQIMLRAGLQGRRIDVLSIDVEHSELLVLGAFPFGRFDIRYLIVEVTPDSTWAELDKLLHEQGFLQVALLGRDVVFASASELQMLMPKITLSPSLHFPPDEAMEPFEDNHFYGAS